MHSEGDAVAEKRTENVFNGAEALVRMLEAHGVRHIFGLCGDTTLPFYDALYRLVEAEGRDGRLELRQTKKAWAAELGLTHEALYRALAGLQREGRVVATEEDGVLVLKLGSRNR